jgi:putative membrane protein
LITIVGPPLMLLGVPAWLWHAIAGGAPRVWRVWRFITRPVIAYVFFNITFMAVHVPAFYNLALRNENVHILEHLLVWIPAFPAWWCVVAPSRELGALSPPLKALYLFVSTIPGQVVGALITFSGSILYDEYSHANRVWGLSPKVDQEIGGLIMWVGVGVFYLAVALVILFRWAAANEAKERGYGQPASGPALR